MKKGRTERRQQRQRQHQRQWQRQWQRQRQQLARPQDGWDGMAVVEEERIGATEVVLEEKEERTLPPSWFFLLLDVAVLVDWLNAWPGIIHTDC